MLIKPFIFKLEAKVKFLGKDEAKDSLKFKTDCTIKQDFVVFVELKNSFDDEKLPFLFKNVVLLFQFLRTEFQVCKKYFLILYLMISLYQI